MRNAFFLLMILLPFQLIAQNLVTNPDFETKAGCPTGSGQYQLGENWSIPNPGTPDYFNDCSTSYEYGTEFNCKGGQLPHSGHGYMGFVSENLHRNTFYEYLEIGLKEPLKEGQLYCVTMFVSPGNSTCVLRELGVILSVTQLKGFGKSCLLLPYTPVSAGIALDRSDDWTCVKGTYNAKGGETWLTLGNFGGDENFIRVRNDPKVDSTFLTAYYFVDDVSVVAVPDSGCNCP
jgi:OmpA-OmpF porin, OOP family